MWRIILACKVSYKLLPTVCKLPSCSSGSDFLTSSWLVLAFRRSRSALEGFPHTTLPQVRLLTASVPSTASGEKAYFTGTIWKAEIIKPKFSCVKAFIHILTGWRKSHMISNLSIRHCSMMVLTIQQLLESGEGVSNMSEWEELQMLL